MVERWRQKKVAEEQNRLREFFRDYRSLRIYLPLNDHDQRTERDIAMALLFELRSTRKKALRPIQYWGILLPEEIDRIVLNKYIRHCPNCVDAVYTNVWTGSDEFYRDHPWENLFVLSPNYRYPPPFNDMVDCNNRNAK